MAHLIIEGLEAEMLPILIKAFPRAFFPIGRNCRPLRVGLFEDLNAVLPPEIDRATLKLCLGLYTGQSSYLGKLKPGAIRIGLNGCPAGRVSPKEAASAAARLQKLRSLENGLPVAKASASYPASTPEIVPPALTAMQHAINPRRLPSCNHIDEAVTRKKSTQPGQQRVVVVVKRRKMPLESSHHRS